MAIVCCKDCHERHIGCHSECEVYKIQKSEHEHNRIKRLKNKNMIKEQEDYAKKKKSKYAIKKEEKKMKVVLDKGSFMPEKAHTLDAGFDLRTPFDITVKGGNHAIIDTGVHFEIPVGFVGMLKSKSGLNVKYNLVSEGVIDAGYTGSIVVKLYNNGIEDYHFKKGDKITQLVLLPIPYIKNEDLVLVDSLEETERGDSGFGSTGK